MNAPVKLCRFTIDGSEPRVGMFTDTEPMPSTPVPEDASSVMDLSGAGVSELTRLLESPDRLDEILKSSSSLPRVEWSRIKLLAPLERQEVWAAGVTYLRSKTARMEESDFSANAYARVYEAKRPEIFFKAHPQKVVGPGGSVGIRADSRWSVPEPELALVITSSGKIVGYTIGNDMSSRDIEGENLLYLPQAKTYRSSCALGPCVVVGASEAQARQWSINLSVKRPDAVVFHGETRVDRIKRSFQELVDYLFRSQEFPAGAILLTGTGIVPPDSFTLEPGDQVIIRVSGIGVLENTVIQV